MLAGMFAWKAGHPQSTGAGSEVPGSWVSTTTTTRHHAYAYCTAYNTQLSVTINFNAWQMGCTKSPLTIHKHASQAHASASCFKSTVTVPCPRVHQFLDQLFGESVLQVTAVRDPSAPYRKITVPADRTCLSAAINPHQSAAVYVISVPPGPLLAIHSVASITVLLPSQAAGNGQQTAAMAASFFLLSPVAFNQYRSWLNMLSNFR